MGFGLFWVVTIITVTISKSANTLVVTYKSHVRFYPLKS